MAAISFPTAADTPSRTTYTINAPWTDSVNGGEWWFSSTKVRWMPVVAGGGASDFGDLGGVPADNAALADALALKAPLASPTFTGTVTASGAVTSGARVTATRGTVGVGTVYTNFGLTNIAGTSTDFLSRFVVGDSITFNTTGGPETRMITAIASDTSMTTFPFSGASASGAESYTHTTASATMNPSGAISGTRGTFSGPVSVSGLTITGTPLPISSGGTGGATASAARTALGSKAVGDLLFQAETVADVVTTVGGVVKTEIFNTSGTWTKAPGAKLLKIIVVGGGGGGGGGSTGAAGTNRRGGGGGSGGGVAEVEVFATDLPDSLPVTVGAGAPGGGAYGGNGGTSSFGSYFGRGGQQGHSGYAGGGSGGGQVYSASVTVGHAGVAGATGGLPGGSSNTLSRRFGISGGGGGGGITDANARGGGGTTSLQEGSALDAAGAYSPQFPAAATAIGQAGGAGVKLHVLGFGGGGGGAAGDTAGTINGGAGGTGVAGGGGGGGGSATSPATAGAGGPGGAGFVLIQTYF